MKTGKLKVKATEEEIKKARGGLEALWEIVKWFLMVTIPVWLILTILRLVNAQTLGWTVIPLILSIYLLVRHILTARDKKVPQNEEYEVLEPEKIENTEESNFDKVEEEQTELPVPPAPDEEERRLQNERG